MISNIVSIIGTLVFMCFTIFAGFSLWSPHDRQELWSNENVTCYYSETDWFEKGYNYCVDNQSGKETCEGYHSSLVSNKPPDNCLS